MNITALAWASVAVAASSLSWPGGAAAAEAAKLKPFSDTFTKDTALDPRWTLAEPNASSFYTIGSKGLLLDSSGQNGGSDLWPTTNYDASLLLQPIDPTQDYTVTTSMKFASANNYMGAGLVVTQQTTGFTSGSVFHRFEYGHNPTQGLESFTNGTPDPNYVGYTAGIVALRLQKAGSTYTYSYSTNGHSFTVISTLTDAAAYTYVGLISIRQPYDGQTMVDSKPLFRYFKIRLAKN